MLTTYICLVSPSTVLAFPLYPVIVPHYLETYSQKSYEIPNKYDILDSFSFRGHWLTEQYSILLVKEIGQGYLQ